MPQHRFAFAVPFGFPTEASQKMSQQTLVALDCEGIRFRLHRLRRREEVFIRVPIVGHHLRNPWVLDGLPETGSGHDASRASDSSEEAFAKSINSKPDPTVVFLCLT